MTTPFTSYQFATAGANALRTLPDRLGKDAVNVKDWGALGDGIHNDSSAIQNAIDYLYALQLGGDYSRGTVLYFPPGTYYLGTPPLRLGPLVTGSGGLGLGTIVIAGAGMDVTILKGTYATGQCASINTGALVHWSLRNQGQPVSSPLGSEAQSGGVMYILAIKNLTIWNESTDPLSFAYYTTGNGIQGYVENVHFKGASGAVAVESQYGGCYRNCKFTSTIAVPAANADTPDVIWPRTGGAPPFWFPGTTGILKLQGALINNTFDGFDVGIGHLGLAGYCSGNKITRCRLGALLGMGEWKQDTSGLGAHASPERFALAYCNGLVFVGNRIDRCTRGIDYYSAGTITVASNIISGAIGRNAPATISNMVYSGGTTTVTTALPHNIPNGRKIQLVGINPAGFLPSPDPTTPSNGFVTATVTDSTHFRFTGPNPGSSFVNGSWTYPIESAINGSGGNTCVIFAANVMSAACSKASFDLVSKAEIADDRYMLCFAMEAPYGWAPRPASYTITAAEWQYFMCMGVNPPFGYLTYADLSPRADHDQAIEGREINIIDAQLTSLFGGIVSGGGSTHHYKVRYDGSNWIRVA